MIRELQSFQDDNGDDVFIITPGNSIEEVLIHLVSEIDDDPYEGFAHLEECIAALRNDIGLPQSTESEDA